LTSVIFALPMAWLLVNWSVDSERLVDSTQISDTHIAPFVFSWRELAGTVARRDVVDVRLIGDCTEGPESVETPVTMGSESLDAPGT
jgi:hypothetical protein